MHRSEETTLSCTLKIAVHNYAAIHPTVRCRSLWPQINTAPFDTKDCNALWAQLDIDDRQRINKFR